MPVQSRDDVVDGVEFRRELRMLKRAREPLPCTALRRPGQGSTGERDGSGVCLLCAEDAVHQGGLACPVRADKADHLSRSDAERDIVDSADAAVGLVEPAHFE